MSERTDRRLRTRSRRVALTALMVASGLGVKGVVPAIAPAPPPPTAAGHAAQGPAPR